MEAIKTITVDEITFCEIENAACKDSCIGISHTEIEAGKNSWVFELQIDKFLEECEDSIHVVLKGTRETFQPNRVYVNAPYDAWVNKSDIISYAVTE